MQALITRIAFALAMLAAITQPARADIVTFGGDTTFAEGYHRAGTWGGQPEFEPFVKYQAFNVTVTESSWLYSFMTSCEFNCVTFFYNDSFDPKNPLQNFFGGDGTDGWQITAQQQNMEPGHNYVFVVAGFYEYDWGKFSTTVGGPGGITVTAVPEPSAALMLMAGLGGLAAFARRRKV